MESTSEVTCLCFSIHSHLSQLCTLMFTWVYIVHERKNHMYVYLRTCVYNDSTTCYACCNCRVYMYVHVDLSVWVYEIFIFSFLPTISTFTSEDEILRRSILINAALLCLFVAQHSLMACQPLKDLFHSWGLSALSRLVYIFATCCTIQVSTTGHTRTCTHDQSCTRTCIFT